MKRFTIVAIGLVVAVTMARGEDANGDDSLVADAKAQQTEAMARILGSSPTGWQFSGPGVRNIVEVEGHPALVLTNGSLWLRNTAVYEPGTAYTVTFRLRPAAGKEANIQVRVGEAEAPKTEKRHVEMRVSTLPAPDQVQYAGLYMPHHIQTSGTPLQATSGALSLSPVPGRSLAWPETIRAQVEAQTAKAPRRSEMQWTLRLAAEKDRVRVKEIMDRFSVS